MNLSVPIITSPSNIFLTSIRRQLRSPVENVWKDPASRLRPGTEGDGALKAYLQFPKH